MFKTAIRSLVRENEPHDAGRGTNHDFAQYIFYRQRPFPLQFALLWHTTTPTHVVTKVPVPANPAQPRTEL